MSVSRSQVLKLYKNLLTEANKFPSYNYRMYAIRKIRDSFRSHSSLAGPERETQFHEGVAQLRMLRRQVVIGHLYQTDPLVIEKLQ